MEERTASWASGVTGRGEKRPMGESEAKNVLVYPKARLTAAGEEREMVPGGSAGWRPGRLSLAMTVGVRGVRAREWK
jgi:hypothetical protein